MTLVWLGFALIAIVAGFVFLIWADGCEARKQQRALEIAAERSKRIDEDRVWATSRHIEHERAISISLTRANVTDAEDLIDALSTSKPQLDVVR